MKKQNENIDVAMRNAASIRPISYNPDGWKKMAKLLDEQAALNHGKQKFLKRRFLFLLLVLSFTMVLDGAENQSNTMTFEKLNSMQKPEKGVMKKPTLTPNEGQKMEVKLFNDQPGDRAKTTSTEGREPIKKTSTDSSGLLLKKQDTPKSDSLFLFW